MSATTSSTLKNTYGKRKRRRRKRSNMDKKMARIASSVYEQKEKGETELKLYEPPELFLQFIDNAGIIFNLSNLIVTGAEKFNRIGNQIVLKSLFMRLMARGNQGSNNYHNLRLIVFRWLCVGDPTPSSVLQLTTNTQNRHLSQLNNDNSHNAHIFMDNTFSLSKSTDQDLPGIINDKFYIKLRGKAEWQGAGTINERGNVYLLAISDSAAIDAPQLSFTSRLRYIDS